MVVCVWFSDTQLTELGGGQFSVKPFKEHFQRLTFADSQWMNMPHTHTSWVRETYYMVVK